jgi:hypothetical protein
MGIAPVNGVSEIGPNLLSEVQLYLYGKSHEEVVV